jgi:hypothetical protein
MLKILIIILITIFGAFHFNFALDPRNFMTSPRRIRVERRSSESGEPIEGERASWHRMSG